jgi:hypothetical protein
MHRQTDADHESDQGSRTPDCVIRQTCQAPAVFTILANPGILPVASTAAVEEGVPTSAPVLREVPIASNRPPDRRPPRT